MSWQYSDPLNGAFLAAQQNNNTNFGLDNGALYNQPLYSNYDPLFSRYQPRTNFFDKTPATINIFDEIDDFELEVETDNILSARYRVPQNNNNNVLRQPAPYVPSYIGSKASINNLLADSQANDFSSNRSINIDNNNYNQIRKQKPDVLSPNPYTNAFKPIPFDSNNQYELRSTPPSSFKSIDDYPPSVNSGDPHSHNNHHQRYIQYQQRLQDKGESLSELENLKLKQKQDRLQLLNTMQNNPNDFVQYKQPVYQNHQIRKQYSETSIPSTNADPLNSNGPTPPMTNHKNTPRHNNQSIDENYIDLPQSNGSYYYRLNEEQKNSLQEPQGQGGRKFKTVKDKYTTSDYKQYKNNFGFGTQFLPFEAETKEEKSERAKKRIEYARKIKDQNRQQQQQPQARQNRQNQQPQYQQVQQVHNIYNSETILDKNFSRRLNGLELPKGNRGATRAK